MCRTKTSSKELPFEESYFHQSPRSNYRDYTARKFTQQAEDIIDILDMSQWEIIVDFGCATGGFLSELKERGFWNIRGTDPSYWAISYGKEQLGLDCLQYYNVNMLAEPKDVLVSLDVFEHIPTEDELRRILEIARKHYAARAWVVRIPVSAEEGEDYVLEVSRNDKTHFQRHSKIWWLELFNQMGWEREMIIEKPSIYESEGVLAWVLRPKENEE